MPIVQAGDPVLRAPARPVPAGAIGSVEVAEVIEALFAALEEVPGVGVAAPQIGVSRRIVLIQDPAEFHEGADRELLARHERSVIDPYVLINPELEPIGPSTRTFFEGCLSVDGYRALVERAHTVRVRWTDPRGERHEAVRQGWHARILQHEVDHIDGVLYVDRMLTRSLVSTDHYDHWGDHTTEAVRQAFGIS